QERDGRIQMESHALLRHLVVWPHASEVRAGQPVRTARVVRAAVLVVVVLSAGRPALAQFEFTGSWTPVASEDFSNDSLPVDYMGLPLTEEGRARALGYSESRLAMVQPPGGARPP